MRLREVFLWLIIFVIGSLIVTFLISPNSFSSFKDNIQSLKPTANPIQNIETIKILPSEVTECSFCMVYFAMGESCVVLDSLGESEGISNMRRKVCEQACGAKEMNYYSNNCIKDKLECYCSR